MTEPLLELCDLRTVFDTEAGPAAAVDGVSLELGRGETLGLVGESGCGKSITALSILRLLPAGGRIAGGDIRFAGRSLPGLDAAAMRRVRGREIGLVFQDPTSALNPVLACGEQLFEVLRVHLGLGRRAARARGLEMLRRVRLPEPERVAQSYPHELSGGMCQRVGLAIALACEPSLLIADEPTTALDVTIQASICDLLLELQASTHMAMLLISHDLGLVAGMADRVAIMYAGRIVEEGPARRLFAAPRHPYTLGLLGSLPGTERRVGRLPAIPGNVPDPTDRPTHCRFHDRCRFRIDVCGRSDPALRPVGPEQAAACFVDVPGASGAGGT